MSNNPKLTEAQRCAHRTGCWPRTPVPCAHPATHALQMPYGIEGYTDGFGVKHDFAYCEKHARAKLNRYNVRPILVALTEAGRKAVSDGK